MGWFSEDPKKTHVVKTDFWGKKTYHDPKTGKKLDRNVKDQKLKKAGWW